MEGDGPVRVVAQDLAEKRAFFLCVARIHDSTSHAIITCHEHERRGILEKSALFHLAQKCSVISTKICRVPFGMRVPFSNVSKIVKRSCRYMFHRYPKPSGAPDKTSRVSLAVWWRPREAGHIDNLSPAVPRTYQHAAGFNFTSL